MKKSALFLATTSLLSLYACNNPIEQKSLDKDITQAIPEPVVLEELEKAEAKSPAPAKKIKQQIVSRTSAGYAMDAIAGLSQPMNTVPVHQEQNREKYTHLEQNGIVLVKDSPVSTFSIDVDTGSYTNSRRMIADGVLPPKDAVRIEEFINYFSYNNEKLASHEVPFSVMTEVGPTPWNNNTRLMRISLDSTAIQRDQLKASNLVFLIDVSGSMRSPYKLELLKKSLKLLARQMRDNDRIAIVVYAGASGVALEPVAGNDVIKIEQALDKLQAGGSTNGSAGIKLAYQLARQSFIEKGNNRVILATDGDFNVGTVNQQALIDIIEHNRKQGIALSTLGFGKGNYNDALMEQLADHGNGNHAYIDNLFEAQKVLVDEMGSTLQTVAKDVKIQIEFNPQQISEYRLIGYENRLLAEEDFNNDSVDAGEIGAGHSVTALYEISLKDQPGHMEPRRYTHSEQIDSQQGTDFSNELAYIKLRYKEPSADNSKLLTFPVMKKDVISHLHNTSNDFRFAAAVAGYAQKLKGGKYLQNQSWQELQDLAANARGTDANGVRSNFLQMLSMTRTIDTVYQTPMAHE